ncbi:serpin family protein [Candidatus Micrarchaeota archaeon]|nr:serpin family protein [Candidatus Micrarchaeota archaeon]
MKRIFVFVIIFAFLIGFGCVDDKEKADSIGATPQGISDVIDSNNKFAIDMYSQVKSEPGNIFFSPYSISSAFAIVYGGGDGQTADEIKQVFYFPEDTSKLRPNFAAIYNDINFGGSDYELQTANALWVQNNYPLLETYTKTVESYYGGKANNVDFVGNTEGSRQEINSWVEQQTKNKIQNLFPAGSLNPLNRLVITNAIYFKGTWVKQFNKDYTRDAEFRVTPTQKVTVSMMQLTGENADFDYTETDNIQILQMPYEGDKLSMLILLPKDDDISLVENELSIENLNNWRKNLKQEKVYVYLPKFTFTKEYNLNNHLITMGMPSSFDAGKADFSGMTNNRDLFINKVVHKAFVDVNEEGTEAAAATGIAFTLSASSYQEHYVFRADHPFIFLIQDTNSGNILFIGRVNNPSS